MVNIKTIAVCSSANFYREVVNLQNTLQKIGFQVLIPQAATQMKESGDFDVNHYKTWFGDANDYHKKTKLMRDHFTEIEKADAILVVNNEKHGTQNYIGGNVLMEMTIAFYLNKKIYILNDLPNESAFMEEIMGMNPIVLHGDIASIKI